VGVGREGDKPAMFISAAEPAWLKDKLATAFDLQSSNLITESRGVDVAWRGGGGWWGIQRKAVDDLVASIGDRLTREVAQMTATDGVVMPHMIVEGQVRFTADGELIRDGWGQRMTRRQWRGLMWSMQAAGVSITHTATKGDTAQAIIDMYAWSQKERHATLRARAGAPKSDWGTRDSKAWARWILQGFDGIGPEVADAIIDACGGLPLQWTVTADELLKIKGIGKTRAGRLIDALATRDSMGGG
jgi:ERCC4-type nuclease